MFYKIILIILIFLIFFGYLKREELKIFTLNLLIVLRGILAPNCFWFNISDKLLTDGAGVNLYNDYKLKYGDFVGINMFGNKIYVVTNNKYIKTILDNSPDLFSAGKLKTSFFKSFMSKNVGVSKGCPWKERRYINELALVSDKLHKYSEKYNNDMINQLIQWKDLSEVSYKNFFNLGKIMVAKIVFNTNKLDDKLFKIFSEANSIQAFYNPNFKISGNVYDNYINTLNYYINNPKENSLIELCLTATNDKDEVLHQIPHFMFPIVGLFISTIPRLLLLLYNHPDAFNKVITDVYSVDDNTITTHEQIYNLSFLRKCVLETLRLNNTVITTFRTLEKDYSFDNKYNFKKGDQFIILNNPVLREKEFFIEPNKFIPSRWTPEMEKSYYAISFNQGPQKCPGKELAIYLVQSFIYNLIKIKNIGGKTVIKTKHINTDNIPQVINPCNIKFEFLSKKSHII